jgi:hypothetical protein
MRSLVFPLTALLTSVACGEADNDLWGAIDESFPLSFDRVDVIKQGLSLRVEYVKELHGGEVKHCKLVVNTESLEIEDNTELGDEYFADGTVVVQRVAPTGGDFPPVENGTVHLIDWNFKAKGRIDGEFSVLFTNGRPLFGNFDGKVTEIDPSQP